jgi:hypothetical protein
MRRSNTMVKSVRMAIAAAIAGGVLGTPSVFAKPADRLVLVPPSSLPAAAREGGESMFLHADDDGRTFLYIQRKQGMELAMLDVTDPAHITKAVTVPFAEPGPSDVVSSPAVSSPAASSSAVSAARGLDDVLVSDVRARLTNAQTGSTFLLTDEGLYVVRRPDDEWLKRFRDQAYQN